MVPNGHPAPAQTIISSFIFDGMILTTVTLLLYLNSLGKIAIIMRMRICRLGRYRYDVYYVGGTAKLLDSSSTVDRYKTVSYIG